MMKNCYTESVFIDRYAWTYEGTVYTMGTEIYYSPLSSEEMGLIK